MSFRSRFHSLLYQISWLTLKVRHNSHWPQGCRGTGHSRTRGGLRGIHSPQDYNLSRVLTPECTLVRSDLHKLSNRLTVSKIQSSHLEDTLSTRDASLWTAISSSLCTAYTYTLVQHITIKVLIFLMSLDLGCYTLLDATLTLGFSPMSTFISIHVFYPSVKLSRYTS